MPASFEPIASYTVTGSALDGPTGVTFSSISASYTDLRLVVNANTSTAVITLVRFNGDTASNYSYTYVGGSGSAASSGRGSSLTAAYLTVVGHTDANWCVDTMDILNYSNTTTNKTAISRANNAANLGTDVTVNLWRSTSAINQIKIYADRASTWTIGSTFNLYGIRAGA
jgi:hypothetical protein